MFKLLTVFVIALLLAHASERNTKLALAKGYNYKPRKDWAYVALVVVLTLFAGLRTSYNDTQNYMRIFNEAVGLEAFLANPENLNPLANPLYYIFQGVLKKFTNNPQVLIFITSLFTQCCFIRFVKRYSKEFTFSIFIYFTLGTFCLSMAAIKQIMAMSVITLAIPYLEQNKLGRYFLLVLIAMLLHTYAIAFAVLPLFTRKPWKVFTYVFVVVMVVLLMNFEEIITTFMEQADKLGKSIAEYEIFDDNTINILRIAVYAVPVVISLIFQKWIFVDSSKMNHVLVHMSIISVALMCLGTQSGANMFGRMGNYFELGAVCCLPWMLKQTFNERSYRLVSIVAISCFLGFFVYGNAVNIVFDLEYYAMSFGRFLMMLL